MGKSAKKSNDPVTVISNYGYWKIQPKVERNYNFAAKYMVVGKISKKSNETVTLLLKHGCWKSQQKVQRNGYSTPETCSLENSTKKSNEIIALLLKHGCCKNQVKVQRNYNFAPETLLEKSAKSSMKLLLCFRNMVVGKVSRKSNEMVTLLLKHVCWKIQHKNPTKSLLCS